MLHPLPESVPMRGRKPSFTIQLVAPHLQELEHWQRSTNLKQGLARRARLLLLLHHGHSLKDAARTAGFSVRNARQWAQRYLAQGLPGLADQPGRGRQPVFSPRGGAPPGQDGLRTAG
jgi:Helix-turn-helix domain